MTRGLVLAGGGLAGIAWELGVLLGIRDEAGRSGIRPHLDADVVVGTSAGAAVAAQVTSGADLADLYAVQLGDEHTELEVELDPDELNERFARAMEGVDSPEEARRRIGTLALATDTVAEEVRLAVVAGRLPSKQWPDRRLLIPAVDARSGELAAFTGQDGVDLVDAVAASCAVPGVWPPVTIGARRYVDGGVRSMTNAYLAAGCDRILIISPSPPGTTAMWGADLDAELAGLAPAATLVLYADEDSVAAFGSNPLSPATRPPSARAGREVGRRVARQVAEFWG